MNKIINKLNSYPTPLNSYINGTWQKIARTVALVATILVSTAFNTYAVEWGGQYLHGSDSGSDGFGISLSEKFSHKSPFSWTLGYSKLNDVVVDWNGSELTFPIETIDAYISYRFTPHSYNPAATGLSYDLFSGISVTVSENKFTWPELNEEKYFSETNDINFLMGGALRYTFTSAVSVQLGVKYYPDFSDFDDVTSMYAGFYYRFGRNRFF